MRQCIAGDGSDSTAAVKAYLAAGNQFTIAHLYLIGDIDDPAALYLTDWESPLSWPVYGTFQSAVIKRSAVTTAIGLEVQSLDVTWTPLTAAYSANQSSANQYQLAQIGYYDNMKCRVWKVYMPTPGDANTFGCSELFGGLVAKVAPTRGALVFTINSFLDRVNEVIPTQTIELTNPLASNKGATPPAGVATIPQFNVIAGSTEAVLIADETSPTAHHIYPTAPTSGNLQLGFVVFNSGGTLDGFFSAILGSELVIVGGIHYNKIFLCTPLPWAPTPGSDTFYVSAAFPINKDDGSYYGFPYVPQGAAGV